MLAKKDCVEGKKNMYAIMSPGCLRDIIQNKI